MRPSGYNHSKQTRVYSDETIELMSSSDNELIMRAQKGDRRAFEDLVQRHDRRVLAIALTYTRNSEDAKDIYQEVFLRVHRALPKFQFRSLFSTWLHRITTNVCLTHRTRSKDHLLSSLDDDPLGEGPTARGLLDTLSSDENTETALVRSEISVHIEDAMKALSPQQKMVFTLRHYNGHKIREIAEIMNCAEGTVKKYLFTATERMRKQLKPVYGL